MAFLDYVGLARVVERLKAQLSPPVGYEFFQTSPIARDGTLPLQGGIFLRQDYPQLWEWVQTQNDYLIEDDEWISLASYNDGPVPFYSSGDGATTFRVPDLSTTTFYYVTHSVVAGLSGSGPIGRHFVVAVKGALWGA